MITAVLGAGICAAGSYSAFGGRWDYKRSVSSLCIAQISLLYFADAALTDDSAKALSDALAASRATQSKKLDKIRKQILEELEGGSVRLDRRRP